MRKNELVLDKFSIPQNHPLYLGMMTYESITKEIQIDELIRRVQRKRKSIGNVADEVRVLRAVGLLIGLGKVGYYKGFVYKK